MEELNRLLPRRNAELAAQGVDAGAVLAADQLLLVLRAETAHEEPVHGLTARVGDHRELAEPYRLGQLAAVEVDGGQLLQGLEVQLLEMALFRQEPVAGRVIVEERPPVEPDGRLVGIDGRLGPAGPAGRFRVAERGDELVPRSIHHSSWGLRL